MESQNKVNIAILDDYQGVALKFADWTRLQGKANLTVFRDHITDPTALAERLRPFQILCVMRERTPLPASILAELPNLKLIITTGRRNASIDLAAALRLGITVSHTGYTSHGANEMTWALILGLLRHIPAEATAFREGGWQTTIGGDLCGKTIGLLGLGKLGAASAKVAQAFGMRVLAWSQNLTPQAAAEHGAQWVDKATLLRESDIVSVHLVLSARTRGILGAAELSLMKPTAYLINTSRGPLVDEAALVHALQNRLIAGAALDVYDTEPLPLGHPLRRLDNVLATSHLGFVTEETYKVFYLDTVENIEAWLKGEPKRILGIS